MSRALVALALVVPVAVAFPPPPKPKADSQYYFPVEKGAKWVYDRNGKEQVLLVSAVTDKGAEKHVVTSVVDKGKERPHQTWAVSEKGLAVLDVGSQAKFDEPLRELRLPVKPGDKWTFHVKGRGLREEEGTFTVVGIEEVEVPAGKFKECRVEAEVTSVKGQALEKLERATRWFAPGVGLVKMEYGGTKGLPAGKVLLKSFTPGKR